MYIWGGGIVLVRVVVVRVVVVRGVVRSPNWLKIQNFQLKMSIGSNNIHLKNT